MSSMEGTRERLKVDLRGAKVLSLDIFDTCLLRRVGHPADVFDLIELELIEDDDLRSLSGGSVSFKSLRIRAEKQARERLATSHKSHEVNLDEIYREFERISGVGPKDSERLKHMELEFEQHLIIANPEILALTQEARRRRLRVVYISDMYLPTGFVVDLLRRGGYEVEDGSVYVSAEYRKAKWSGDLYPLVSKAVGIPPRQFVHVGDNLYADVTMARRSGMRAHHYEKLAERLASVDMQGRDGGQRMPRPERSLALGVRDAIVSYQATAVDTPSLPSDFWFRLGYERAGSLILGFTLWLSEQCKQDNIDRLIFLARDGHIMKQCFDLIQEWRGEALQTTYMYASRRALVFPALLTMDEDDLAFLASGVRETVRNYLGRCSLDPELFEIAAQAAGLPSLDHRVETDEDALAVRKLFQTIARDVLRASSAESRNVLAYFDQLGIPSVGRIGLVDIGWLGSMQQGFEKLLRLSGRSASVQGFYVGMYDGARRRMNNGQNMKGYLTTLAQPSEINNWIVECVELVEFLFLAPHGSCLGYDQVDGVIVPRLEDNPYEAENTAKAMRVQEGVLAFLHDARPLIVRYPHLALDARGAFFPYAQVIKDPTRAEAQTLGDLTHVQNFGTSERAYIAKVQRHHKTGEADASKPFWRAGYARLIGQKLRS